MLPSPFRIARLIPLSYSTDVVGPPDAWCLIWSAHHAQCVAPYLIIPFDEPLSHIVLVVSSPCPVPCELSSSCLHAFRSPPPLPVCIISFGSVPLCPFSVVPGEARYNSLVVPVPYCYQRSTLCVEFRCDIGPGLDRGLVALYLESPWDGLPQLSLCCLPCRCSCFCVVLYQ